MNEIHKIQSNRTQQTDEKKRLGAILVLAALFMVAILGFTSFTVDVGYIALTRTQMQAAADAAALAGMMELPEGWGMSATVSATEVDSLARSAAVEVAGLHRNGDRASSYVDSTRDIRLGRRELNEITGEWDEFWSSPPYNMVEVTLRRNVSQDPDDGVPSPSGGGDAPLNLFFGPVIGNQTAGISVSATAALRAGVGFRIDSGSNETTGVLPITLDIDTWNDLLAGTGVDDYTYNSDTGAVTNGSDGVLELDLYPTSDNSLPPGNRGTVDFGSSNNSTADLSRQIVFGLNANDLSYFGGTISASDESPFIVNGDTGISAGIKDELSSIIGQPRVIPLFREVSGPGNNAMYTIVKFVGIRIVSVRLTGKNKYVMIQPASYYDASIVTDPDVEITEDSLLGPGVLLR